MQTDVTYLVTFNDGKTETHTLSQTTFPPTKHRLIRKLGGTEKVLESVKSIEIKSTSDMFVSTQILDVLKQNCRKTG